MRVLPIFVLMFSCAAWGGVLPKENVDTQSKASPPAVRAVPLNKTMPSGRKVVYSDKAMADLERGDPGPARSLDTIETPTDGQPASNSRFVWPTEGKVISGFDPTRKGIDIAGKAGQPVLAAGNGKVLYAKNMRGYGNLIILEHGDSMVTAYAHNKTILVQEGQMVSQSQQIAEMGNSDADTVKLRFQMRHLGKPIDPVALLPPRANTAAEIDAYEAENAFENASKELIAKNFSAAAKLFTAFLKRYPGSKYEAQAYYFGGSSYFANGSCNNAIPMFQTVIDRFPASERAPDAMLNLAICQEDVHETRAAFQTMEELIKKYPQSIAAETARQKVSTLAKVPGGTDNSGVDLNHKQRTEEQQRPEENGQLNNPNNLPPCLNGEYRKCWGTFIAPSGDKYVGEFRDGKYTGQGTYSWANGAKYVGEFKDGKEHGQGTYTFADGRKLEGIWENGNLVRETNATVSSEKNQAVNDVKPSASRDANPPKMTRSRDRKSVEKKMPSTPLPTTSKQNGDFR